MQAVALPLDRRLHGRDALGRDRGQVREQVELAAQHKMARGALSSLMAGLSRTQARVPLALPRMRLRPAEAGVKLTSLMFSTKLSDSA